MSSKTVKAGPKYHWNESGLEIKLVKQVKLGRIVQTQRIDLMITVQLR